MIETVLIFLAGVLSAGLGALLLIPAINSRAVRLYRRRMDQQLPRSLAELIAAKDAVRAEMAARMARVEVELDAARQKIAVAEMRSFEDRRLASAAQAEKAGYEATIVDYERRLEEARAVARYAHEAVARVDAERRELQRQISRRDVEAVESRDEAESLAADMKMALVEAEARIAVLSETIVDMTGAVSQPIGGAAAGGASAATPVIHVDFVGKTGLAAEPARASGAGETGVEEDARIDDLAQRLRMLRARNAVARQRIDSALAKGGETDVSADSSHSGTPVP